MRNSRNHPRDKIHGQQQARRHRDELPTESSGRRLRSPRSLQCLFQTRPEARPRLIIEPTATHSRSERPQIFYRASARLAALHMLFDFNAAHQIQLSIHVSVEKHLSIVATHAAPPWRALPRSAICNRLRARASLDITVPKGTPAIPPISLYDKPSNSRSTIASRNSTGRSSSAWRSISLSTLRSRSASGLDRPLSNSGISSSSSSVGLRFCCSQV